MAPPTFMPVKAPAGTNQIVGNMLTVRDELQKCRDAAQTARTGFDDVASKLGFPDNFEEETRLYNSLKEDLESLNNEQDELEELRDRSREAYGKIAMLKSDELVNRAIRIPDEAAAMLLRANQAVFSNLDNIMELKDEYKLLMTTDDQYIASQLSNADCESQLADTNNVRRLKAALEVSEQEATKLREKVDKLTEAKDAATSDLQSKLTNSTSKLAAAKQKVTKFRALADDREELRRELDRAEDQFENIKKDLQRATDLSERYVEERDFMKASLDKTLERIDRRETKIKDLQNELRKVQIAVFDQEASNQVIQRLYDKMANLTTEYNQKYSEMEDHLTQEKLTLSSENTQLKQKVKDLEYMHRTDELDLALARDNNDARDQDSVRLKGMISEAQRELTLMRKELTEARDLSLDSRSSARKARSDRDSAFEEIVTLKESKERLERMLQKALVHAGNQQTGGLHETTINTMENKINDLEDKIMALTIDRDALEDSNKLLTKKEEQTKRTISQLHESIRAGNEETSRLTRSLEEAQERQLEAENKLAGPTQELAQLQFQMRLRDKELAMTKRISDQRKADHDGLQQSYTDVMHQRDRHQVEADQAKLDVQRLEQSRAQANERATEYECRMNTLTVDNQRLQKELDRVQNEKNTAHSQLERSLQDEVTSVKRNLQAKTQMYDAESHHHVQTRQALSQKMEENLTLTKDLNSRQNDLEGKERDITALKHKLSAEKEKTDAARESLQKKHKDMLDAVGVREQAVSLLSRTLVIVSKSSADSHSFQGLVELLLQQGTELQSDIDTYSTPWIILDPYGSDEDMSADRGLEANIVEMFGAIQVGETSSPAFLETVAQLTMTIHRSDRCRSLRLDVLDNILQQFASRLHDPEQPHITLSVWQIMSIIEERWIFSNSGWDWTKQTLEAWLTSVHLDCVLHAMKQGNDEAFKDMEGCNFFSPHFCLLQHPSWTTVIVFNLEEHTLRVVDKGRIDFVTSSMATIKAIDGQQAIMLPISKYEDLEWIHEVYSL